MAGVWAYWQNDLLAVAAGNYALIQDNVGNTWLNAATGEEVGLRVNNVTQLVADGSTVTATVPIVAPAATTSIASVRMPHGAAPSVPTNGDWWTTTAGAFVQINGSTVGPLGTGGSSGITTGKSIALSNYAIYR